jgi:hypothetical protein
MCASLGIVPHPEKYYHEWVDTIGLALASGQSFGTIIKDCHEAIGEQSKIGNQEGINYWTTKLKIAEYLNDNFIARDTEVGPVDAPAALTHELSSIANCLDALEAAFQSPMWKQLPEQEKMRLVGRLSYVLEIAERQDLDQ